MMALLDGGFSAISRPRPIRRAVCRPMLEIWLAGRMTTAASHTWRVISAGANEAGVPIFNAQSLSDDRLFRLLRRDPFPARQLVAEPGALAPSVTARVALAAVGGFRKRDL